MEDMWSISEYVDHVREVLFSMRFLADSAVESPGLDLGAPPEPEFSPEPRAIDLSGALGALDREARALATRLDELNETEWDATAPIGAMLVAPFGREDLLLQVAAQLEVAVPWRDRVAGIYAS
jgi:hypothetical protein